MPCPQCQHENPEGLKFCNQCGTPLSGHCAECGFTNQPGSKFCGECGTSLPVYASGPDSVQSIRHKGPMRTSKVTLVTCRRLGTMIRPAITRVF